MRDLVRAVFGGVGLIVLAVVMLGLASMRTQRPESADPRDSGTWILEQVHRDNKGIDSLLFAKCVRVDVRDRPEVDIVVDADAYEDLADRLALNPELSMPCPAGPLRT